MSEDIEPVTGSVAAEYHAAHDALRHGVLTWFRALSPSDRQEVMANLTVDDPIHGALLELMQGKERAE